MVAIASCPEPARLQALLDSSLSDDERRGLEDHVGHCSGCQETLEVLATGDPSWSATLRGLGGDTPPVDSAFWPALRQLGRTEVTPTETPRAGDKGTRDTE